VPDDEAHGTFADVLESAEPPLREICEALRERITALHPDAVEIVWKRQRIASYGVGPKKMSEHYAYIAPQGKHVNLGFYRGAGLNDPSGLLEGTGKELRHVKIRSVAEARAEEIRKLLAEAIAERRHR
jgi:hypothetical protein